MIDRRLLGQMGFRKGVGWDHEVWVYDGDFWVHYGGEFSGLDGKQIYANSSLKEFFKMFIKNIKE